MNVAQIRLRTHAEPFQPLTICLSNGQKLALDHPELLAISLTQDTLLAHRPDGSFLIVGTEQITSLLTRKGRPRSQAS